MPERPCARASRDVRPALQKQEAAGTRQRSGRLSFRGGGSPDWAIDASRSVLSSPPRRRRVARRVNGGSHPFGPDMRPGAATSRDQGLEPASARIKSFRPSRIVHPQGVALERRRAPRRREANLAAYAVTGADFRRIRAGDEAAATKPSASKGNAEFSCVSAKLFQANPNETKPVQGKPRKTKQKVLGFPWIPFVRIVSFQGVTRI